MGKIQVNTTLDPENVAWLDKGISENRFPSRSAGVDYALSSTMRRESPEAIQAAREMELQLRDTEERARKAEQKLEAYDATAAELIPKLEGAFQVMEGFDARLKAVTDALLKETERALREASDRLIEEREKRARAEDQGFRYALGYVQSGDVIQQQQALIEELKADAAFDHLTERLKANEIILRLQAEIDDLKTAKAEAAE